MPRIPGNFTPANPANPFSDYTEEQSDAFLNGYELTRGYDSEYEYSNYAAGLLGHVLAAKRELTYEELMMEVIANPLEMKNTNITLSTTMKENLAIGHSNGTEVENWDIPTLAGAGAIRSTVGKYQQAPGFIITIAKDGKQMSLQATGQNKFGLFPKSETDFYLTVVDAQVVFNNNEDGKVESLTLFQGGQELVGPRLED